MTTTSTPSAHTGRFVRRVRTLAILALIAAVIVAALSMIRTVASPAEEVAVHLGGGVIEAPNSKGCIAANSREIRRTGDKYFWYPASQRTFHVTGGEGTDHGPFSVVSTDHQPLSADLWRRARNAATHTVSGAGWLRRGTLAA